MADMTATTLATYLPEVWSTLATITYRTTTVLAELFDRRWEPELGVGRGDTVNIPAFSQNSSSNVTARTTFGTGATIDFTAVTESQVQLVVNKMAYHAFRLPVEMSVQVMAKYEKLLITGDQGHEGGVGQSLSAYMDNQLAADNSNGLDAFTAIGSDNVAVTEDDIKSGMTNLNTYNAPLEGRAFVYSPATYSDLLNIESLRNQLYASSTGTLSANKGPGFQGRAFTLDFYMSNNLEAGTAGKKNAIWHKEAIALCVQQNVKFLKGINIADGGFNEYMGFLVFGHKMVNSNLGREVDGK